MDKGLNQDNSRECFQSEGIVNFNDTVPCLGHLFRTARRHAGRERPAVSDIGVGNVWLERRCRDEGWAVCALDPNKSPIETPTSPGTEGKAGVTEDMPMVDDVLDAESCSDLSGNFSAHKIKQILQWVLGRLGAGHVYTNLLFIAEAPSA